MQRLLVVAVECRDRHLYQVAFLAALCFPQLPRLLVLRLFCRPPERALAGPSHRRLPGRAISRTRPNHSRNASSHK